MSQLAQSHGPCKNVSYTIKGDPTDAAKLETYEQECEKTSPIGIQKGYCVWEIQETAVGKEKNTSGKRGICSFVKRKECGSIYFLPKEKQESECKQQQHCEWDGKALQNHKKCSSKKTPIAEEQEEKKKETLSKSKKLPGRYHALYYRKDSGHL